jgi:glycosyltransferase involved in cell wall biosynthesis
MVPADFSRRVFLDAAPRARVRVVPLGLDAASWPVQRRERRPGAPFVFLMVGDLSSRKGWRIAYSAFYKAFGDDPRVQLVLKTRGSSELAMHSWSPRRVPAFAPDGQPMFAPDGGHVMMRNREPVRYYAHNGDWGVQPWGMPPRGDANVRILRGEWSKRNLLKLYAAADCFVWPSLGEGWGYPPREAAATGLPVITCAHTGMEDAGEWAYTIPFEEDRVPALFRHWGGQCGYFPLPDVDALAERMTWVYEHQAAAAHFGALASRVVTRRSTRDAAADILSELAAVGG